MAFRNLTEGNCGGPSDLTKIREHFAQDQAHRQDRAAALPPQLSQSELMVNEFLEQTVGSNMQTFQMSSLIDEMRSIELSSMRTSIQQAPNVAQLAPQETNSLWTEEFLRGEGVDLSRFAPNQNLQLAVPSIERVEFDKMWDNVCSENQKRTNLLRDWTKEFTEEEESHVQPRIENLLGYGVDVDSEEEVDDFIQKDSHENRDDIESIDFWKNMQKVWQSMTNDESVGGQSWETDFLGLSKDYAFEQENPMNEMLDPFAVGLEKLKEGDLPSAVLCFEAAAQKDPTNHEVWQYLGTSQAENEHDPQAIAALRKCLSLKDDNLDALMVLSSCYANENYQNQACHTLKQWIQKNPQYSDLVNASQQAEFDNLSSVLAPTVHSKVRDLYIAAANKIPQGEIDVEVQCGLGVLFNLSNEHDKAVDCFKAALQADRNNYRMWNRLGATLANGNRSEEAVDAYYNALQLNPGFIRARYNLGITCINLGAFREAVEHLLTALNQQAKGEGSYGEKGGVGGMSDSIWTTLRLAVNFLGTSGMDVINAIETRNLDLLNQEFGLK